MPWNFGKSRSKDGGGTDQLAIAEAGRWAIRLGGVGRTLDRHRGELRELAVSTAGAETWVSGLAWKDSRYHMLWVTVAFRIDGNAVVDLDDPEPSTAKAAHWLSTSEAASPTADRYWRYLAIGVLLDRRTRSLVDVCLVDVATGVLAQCVLISQDSESDTTHLLSIELTTKEIEDEVYARRLAFETAAVAARRAG